MIDYAFIGARLKEARIRKNMTQEQLAAMTDVGSTHISHIEIGMTIPSTKLLVQMMNILNCDPAEVLCMVEQLSAVPVYLLPALARILPAGIYHSHHRKSICARFRQRTQSP